MAVEKKQITSEISGRENGQRQLEFDSWGALRTPVKEMTGYKCITSFVGMVASLLLLVHPATGVWAWRPHLRSLQ